MQIWFNHVILVAVFIVFVDTSLHVKNVPQNPVANQSSPAKPSVTQSSNKIIFPIPHIEVPVKSKTVTTAKASLVTSMARTTTVTYASIKTAVTTSIEEIANNATAKTPIEKMANNIHSTTSIEETTATQAVTIASVEYGTENQTDQNGLLINRHIVNPKQKHSDVIKDQCPKGYIMKPNGDCALIFPPIDD